MKSIYKAHSELKHDLSRFSPDGTQIIEECKQCAQSFLLIGNAHHFLPYWTAQRAQKEFKAAK